MHRSKPYLTLVTTGLLSLLGTALDSSTAHAQSCPQRPVQAPEGECGQSTIFECKPAEAVFPYTTVLGQAGTGRLDYFLPKACPMDEDGYPTVMLFHGGAGLGDLYEGKDPSGNRRGHGARTIRALLEAGYAVLVPHATSGFNWQTNWPGVVAGTTPYKTSSDYRYLNRLIRHIENPTLESDPELASLFSLLDFDHMFASGMSDGGAQSSRMARSWPGVFKAIAIHSGSWNACAATFDLPFACSPADITWNHAPVLFLHAEEDTVVSVNQADIYARHLERTNEAGNPVEWRAVVALECDRDKSWWWGGCRHRDLPMNLRDYASCTGPNDRQCVSYEAVMVPDSGHDWMKEAPEEHVRWFDAYRQ